MKQILLILIQMCALLLVVACTGPSATTTGQQTPNIGQFVVAVDRISPINQ